MRKRTRAGAVAAVCSLLCAAIAAVHADGAGARAADGFCAAWTSKTLASGLGSLENIEFDGDGGLLVSASGPGEIERLTRDGKVTTLVPGVSSPGGLRVRGRTLFFNTGDSAASGIFGNADGTLERFDLDTHERSVYASGLTMPNGLAFLPDGDAVVSRDLGSGTGITRIPVEDPAHPQFNWADLTDQNGLAVDPTGTWLYADQTFTMDSAVYRIRIADPKDRSVVATLGDGGPKGLDDLTIDRDGILYLAANLTGEVIKLDPASGKHCTIASGFQNTSSLKFGRGPGWPADHLFVVGFDGVVRELTPPADGGAAGGGGGTAKGKPRLALSVRPRTAIAGRRTRFRFTTYRASGGLRANVRVRLGGRSVRTNKRGRAALTLRFRRPGRKVARASRSGYRSATRTIRVRSRAAAAADSR